jgi:hypothetical protein
MGIPGWLKRARRKYHREIYGAGNTSILRSKLVLDTLEQKVFPNCSGPVRILDIGPGSNQGLLATCFEPYVIAACCEAAGVDYKLAILDISMLTCLMLWQRSKIFIPSQDLRAEAGLAEWQRYLKNAEQEDRVVQGPEDEFFFINLATNAPITDQGFIERMIAQGIHVAGVPEGFRERRARGDIMPVQDDIARADVSVYAPYDFVVSISSLYQLSPQGQMLAMDNIRRNMAPKGVFIVEDFAQMTGEPGFYPIFPPRGWFTDKKQRQLGLVTTEELQYQVGYYRLMGRTP